MLIFKGVRCQATLYTKQQPFFTSRKGLCSLCEILTDYVSHNKQEMRHSVIPLQFQVSIDLHMSHHKEPIEAKESSSKHPQR